MNEGLIARRYATAMLRVAQAHNAAGELYGKMKLFEQNYIAHPNLHKALQNPVMSASDKEMLLSTAIGIEPGHFYIRGIRLIIKNHREMYIRSICLMYQRLYRQAFHIGQVKIITATKLGDEAVSRIKKLVTDKTSDTIEFVEHVDSSIIGGFILQVNSRQLDVSLSRGLKEFKMKLK